MTENIELRKEALYSLRVQQLFIDIGTLYFLQNSLNGEKHLFYSSYSLKKVITHPQQSLVSPKGNP